MPVSHIASAWRTELHRRGQAKAHVCGAQKSIAEATMLSVMRSCSNVERQLLLLIQIAIHSMTQHAVNRARDICCMNAIVVRIVRVAGLQRHQERNKPVL
jgi:hypothetical protein